MANWASAAGKWRHRPPIVPDAEDITWFERTAAVCPHNGRLRGLLLGVTADIATMAWPGNAEFVAVDWSAGMVASAWPHDAVAAHEHVVIADWHAMPLAPASRDYAAGDGCYTALGSLPAIRRLNKALAFVLARGGIHAARCFSRGEDPPGVDEVFDELLGGRETNLGRFRWRLMMALQGRGYEGVRLDDLWQVWHERVPDPTAPARAFGWNANEIENIARYAGQQVRYVYPTIEEMRAAAAPEFELVDCDIPTYPHGRHFPRLTFVRR